MTMRIDMDGRLKLNCMNPAATEAEMEKLIELIRSQGRRYASQKANP
jgi:hypothetical protein